MKKIIFKIAIIVILLLGFIVLESNATNINDGIDYENIKNNINNCITQTVYNGEIPDVRKAFKMREGLIEGRDYTVSHSVNSSNVGRYGITITGIGDYKGGYSWTYTITPASIASAKQNKLKDLNYYEGIKKPDDLKLTFNGKELKENVDYTLSVLEGERLDAGERAIYVKGIGNFESTKAVYFTILPADISTTEIDWTPDGYVQYTGSAITKEKIWVTNPLRLSLEEGKDYTVEYKNNVNAGIASIIITGKGNYTGKITKEFEISPQHIDFSQLSVDNTDKQYTGKAITPKVTIGVLEEGKDYTVEYKNNINVGCASIEIKGKGNYTGYYSSTFNIVKTDSPIIDNAGDANDKYNDAAKEEEDKLKDYEDSILNNNTNKNDSTDKKEDTTQKEDNKKEETSKDTSKKEDNKTEETKKEETKVESNEVENIIKEENVNIENNITNISNETINATTTEGKNSNTLILKYALYVAIGALAVGLLVIAYNVFKYRKNEKQ